MGRTFFGANNDNAPSPGVDPHRLPGSTFERMGLIIGAAGSPEAHLRGINHHTKRTADYLEKLLKSGGGLIRSGARDTDPAYHSS
jgi:hypothetical protein